MITLTMFAHRVPDISTGNDGIVDGAHHMVPYNATSVTDIYAKQVLGDIVVTDDGLERIAMDQRQTRHSCAGTGLFYPLVA